MAKRPTPPEVSDDQIRALLARYRCPVAFHAVRTRFLGNIASPDMETSPIPMVEALWGGGLPAFDNLEEANRFLAVVVMGLWNRLTRHQERATPFRLTRIKVDATRDGIAALARLRREELDGFIEGLFGNNESLDLPERAHKALDALAEIRALVAGAEALAEDPTKPFAPRDAAGLLRQFRELTRIAEREIHAAVLSCTRARRQMLAGLPTGRPTIH